MKSFISINSISILVLFNVIVDKAISFFYICIYGNFKGKYFKGIGES